jgi:hypothetical protein
MAAAWAGTITAPLPYDYTSVVGGASATAFDTYGQVFYCILKNPREPGWGLYKLPNSVDP